MDWATGSFPAPLSPEMSTVASVGATRSTRLRTIFIAGDSPIISIKSVILTVLLMHVVCDAVWYAKNSYRHVTLTKFEPSAASADVGVGASESGCRCPSYKRP